LLWRVEDEMCVRGGFCITAHKLGGGTLGGERMGGRSSCGFICQGRNMIGRSISGFRD
jgi:hypothetical protein